MTIYLLIFDLFLVGRAFSHSNEGPTGWRRARIVTFIQAIFLCLIFPVSCHVLFLIFVMALSNALAVWLEPEGGSSVPDRKRFAKQLIFLGLTSILMMMGTHPPEVRLGCVHSWSIIENHVLIGPELSRIHIRRILSWLAAILLCTGEANGVLRLILDVLDVHPQHVTGNLRQYKKGGLIGAFERILVVIFVANNAYNAVGFILTAKGLVRFRDLTNHHEAEYVLIGTLVSTLLAIAVGLLLPHLAG